MKAKLELNGKEYEVEIGDEVVEKIESKVWKPEEGEEIYWLDSSGNIVSRIFRNYYADINDMGFISPTREQAKKYRTWLKWIAEVRRWNVENGNVGVDIKGRFSAYIYWQADKNKLDWSYGDYPVCGSYYFQRTNLAEKFVKDFGEEKIIKMMKLQQEIMEMA